MKKSYHYVGCCVHLDGDDITEMCEQATPVTLATIRKHCEGLKEWEEQHGYGRHLALSKDWHVGFYKSKYRGQPCYYIRWSAIESIWVLQR